MQDQARINGLIRATVHGKFLKCFQRWMTHEVYSRYISNHITLNALTAPFGTDEYMVVVHQMSKFIGAAETLQDDLEVTPHADIPTTQDIMSLLQKVHTITLKIDSTTSRAPVTSQQQGSDIILSRLDILETHINSIGNIPSPPVAPSPGVNPAPFSPPSVAGSYPASLPSSTPPPVAPSTSAPRGLPQFPVIPQQQTVGQYTATVLPGPSVPGVDPFKSYFQHPPVPSLPGIVGTAPQYPTPSLQPQFSSAPQSVYQPTLPDLSTQGPDLGW